MYNSPLFFCKKTLKLFFQGFHGAGNFVPMTVVGVQYHAHSLASAMKLRHIRNTGGPRRQRGPYVENPWIDHEAAFDVEHQTFRLLNERRNVSYVRRVSHFSCILVVCSKVLNWVQYTY